MNTLAHRDGITHPPVSNKGGAKGQSRLSGQERVLGQGQKESKYHQPEQNQLAQKWLAFEEGFPFG